MIYLDHHATTPLDPVVLAAMMPLLTDQFANPGSVTHAAGREVAELVDLAIARIGASFGAEPDEVVVTSGATESNNLAIFGCCLHPRQARRKVISLVSEHRAVLDPLKRLQQQGFEVVLLPGASQASSNPGAIDLDQLADAVDDSTALVSVMLANNEIGTLQPIADVAAICRQHDCWLHTDATQAVGRMPVDVDNLDVDLLSFSAHKFYGPKGVGGLFVRRRGRHVRLQSQVVGGGQQHNMRSGTLNSAGIVGMAAAMDLSRTAAASHEWQRLDSLTARLYQKLREQLEWVTLNGPPLNSLSPEMQLTRLRGNLNCSFYPIEGQSLMLALPDLAMSSGSACTSADPQPSHVLATIGLTVEQSRSSLRFGLGRFNTVDEIDMAATLLANAASRLRDSYL